MDRTRWAFSVLLAAGLAAGAVSRGEEGPIRAVPGWGELVDPSGDCTLAHDPARGRLTIAVPGTPHVLSAEVPGLAMAAPRVLRGVYGDFRARVRVGGRLEPGRERSTSYDPYHGAGLVVWRDGRNYLRLERAVAVIGGREVSYINYELREDGKLAVSLGFPARDRPLHLEIERRGEEVLARQSEDGRKWTALPGISAPFRGKIEVGVIAVNASRKPLKAELEGFELEAIDEPPAEPAGDASASKEEKPR